MKIFVADTLPDKSLRDLESLGAVVINKPKTKAEELAAAIGDCDVLVVRSTEVRADCISSAKNLSLIIRAGAGVNTIDMKSANARGIYVSNCPGKNSVAVAELTMALLLAIDRKIPENVADLRSGLWNKALYSKADGIMGKTIGVIGTGQIGREVIARAKAFGLNVVAWSRSLTDATAEELDVRRTGSIESLMKESDIVSVHLALKPETKKIVSKEAIGLMKPNAIFLNTSRWEVVDEDALYGAAKDGKIRVGLDVLSGEQEGSSVPFSHRLAALPNVYGTHHIGASTEQAQNAIADEVVAIVRQYRDRGTVINWVNRAKATEAAYQLVIRHYDKPGVLANIFNSLKTESINIQEVENLIFDGSDTAVCSLRLESKPSDYTLEMIRSRTQEVIQVQLVEL
jgi:D-3-phosphoglycerate dehydrogenase